MVVIGNGKCLWNRFCGDVTILQSSLKNLLLISTQIDVSLLERGRLLVGDVCEPRAELPSPPRPHGRALREARVGADGLLVLARVGHVVHHVEVAHLVLLGGADVHVAVEVVHLEGEISTFCYK